MPPTKAKTPSEQMKLEKRKFGARRKRSAKHPKPNKAQKKLPV
jgi:hypothetical protein